VNDQNDIDRLDVDGSTVTTVADEQGLIFDFAISPTGDVLAYLTFLTDGTNTLIRANTDGSGRTELARGIIRGVTVADDGSVQAGMLFDVTGANAAALASGAWSFPADGGDPRLLVAATEPMSSGGKTTPGSHYEPIAWAPDGSRLLLRATMNMGPDGPGGDIASTGVALYDVGSGQARDLLPLGMEPLCMVPVWSRDGDTILCANGANVDPTTPPLWRLDLTSGDQQPIIPVGASTDQILSPRELADGIYLLVAESSASLAQQFMLQRIAPDGTISALLPQPIEAGYDGGLWAPDGSGIIVGRPTASANRTIIWQPLGSDQTGTAGEPIELLSGSIGKLEWIGR